MKKINKGILAISCVAVSLFGLSACGNKSVLDANATVLGTPKEVTAMSYEDRQSANLKVIADSAEHFASNFAPVAYSQYGKNDNFTVSPLSVYMALSLAAQCSAGDTRSEILSAFNLSYNQLVSGFSDYYRSLFAEYTATTWTEKPVQVGTITFTNSIWLDEHLTPKQECIDTLADNFFCHSFKCDFAGNNQGTNKAIRKFVKDNTRGLIDKDFKLSPQTVFALINTLYLKDVWNTNGKNLSFTDATYSFKQSNGNAKGIKLLQGYYNYGRAFETDSFSTFFTKTANGNRIDFILPKDGYTVDDVFTTENIETVKGITSYNGVDHEKKQRYYTNCLFPEYEASYDEYIKSVLMDMGISTMFDGDCDFSGLTDDYAYCSDVIHTAKLKVDRTGIEGAAVTIIPAAGSAGPDEYEDVYLNFVVDRAFGFIISDLYGNTLFSGVVKNV